MEVDIFYCESDNEAITSPQLGEISTLSEIISLITGDRSQLS